MKTKTIICLAVAWAAVGTGCEKSGLEMLPFNILRDYFPAYDIICHIQYQ